MTASDAATSGAKSPACGKREHFGNQARRLRRIGQRLQRADRPCRTSTCIVSRDAGTRIAQRDASCRLRALRRSRAASPPRSGCAFAHGDRRAQAAITSSSAASRVRHTSNARCASTAAPRRRASTVRTRSRIAPQVFLRDARAVAAAPQVELLGSRAPARTASRSATNADVVYCDASTPLPASSARMRSARGTGSMSNSSSLVGLERGAVERRRAAGAALVDEDDVAGAADSRQSCNAKGAERRCRLARAAGEHARADRAWATACWPAGRRRRSTDLSHRPADRGSPALRAGRTARPCGSFRQPAFGQSAMRRSGSARSLHEASVSASTAAVAVRASARRIVEL